MRLLGQRQWMCWLALAALIGQLVASFAHPHVRSDAAGRGLIQVAATCQATGYQQPCSPGQPADHRSDCQICWSMALVGNGIAPPAVLVPVPVVICVDGCTSLATERREAGVASSFQARGPPASRAS